MNTERQNARLKRRSERLGPPSRSPRGGSSGRTNSSGYAAAREAGVGSNPSSFSRARGSSIPESMTDARGNTGSSFSRPPPAPMPAASSGAYSSTSATAVSMATRRSASARSPRDINVLVDKLLVNVHGAPSAITTRRTVVRLHDAMYDISVDSVRCVFSVLEKIKRKITADAPQFYANSQDSITRLNEVYSRFVKFKNLDKKTYVVSPPFLEALVLLFGLMDTATPALHSEDVLNHPEFAALSTEKYRARDSPSISIDNSILAGGGDLGVHHRSQSMPAAPLVFEFDSLNASASPVSQSKTDLDSLEDSFKFAVGIAPVHKTGKAKGSSPRPHPTATSASSATASSGGGLGSRTSFEVPEEVLLRDVLYALQAIESRYLFFDDAADRFQITRSVGVPTPMRELIHMLCDLGWFYRKVSDVEGLRGGALASGVHSHVLHGDPAVSQYVQSVMKRVAAPIFRMIKRWVFEGELEDTHTQDDGIQFAELTRLEAMIEKVSNSTNEYLIRTLMERYQLLDHCQALKRYLLLGQGDFIQYLMDLLGPELSKRGTQVYRHTLTNVLETALNSSNAKFEVCVVASIPFVASMSKD
ncbi:hypothetical protein BBJ28_00010445 [Nothophytophthora sp. Chile5]|nr:hypothetical protein BBJ28_00010445 [Nothophytophthora sp. Chile5]